MPPLIGLLGDVMLGRGVAEVLGERAPEEVWSPELRELLDGCDLVVCNLECCISERGRPTARIRGKPFFFRAPPAATRSLAAAGVRLVGLANNHALDFEAEALLDTLTHLETAGIAFAGAGRGPDEAHSGAVVEAGGATVGVLAISDHPREFAAASGEPGIAWAELDVGLPDWAAAELARLRDLCDHLIAFPHWGPNMTERPARWQSQRADDLLAAGVDLLAGHSAHVFHGVERRGDAALAYDLGDALDDYAIDRRLRNDLGLLLLWRPPQVELVGLRLQYARTELARGADADWIARRLERACGEFGTALERADEQRFRL